jgi:hypothetical protein
MKNKTVTYVLLTVAALVWGGIFYRVFSSLSAYDQIATVPVKVRSVASESDYALTTWAIKADYRDPFLGSLAVEKPKQANASVNNKILRKKKIETEAAIDWSFIKYSGLIKNPSRAKKIGLINIQNQPYMINEGEIIQGIKCIRHYRDSIIIFYKGKVACIKK